MATTQTQTSDRLPFEWVYDFNDKTPVNMQTSTPKKQRPSRARKIVSGHLHKPPAGDGPIGADRANKPRSKPANNQ